MEGHETSEDIDRAAAEWAARLDGGRLTPREKVTLDAWAAADTRHFGALARALAVLDQFPQDPQARLIEAPVFRRSRRSARGIARRRFLYGAIGGAAAVGASAAASIAYAQRGEHHTAKGEVRSVPLADGSVIWLNTESQVKVRYGRTHRGVILTRGEAMFEVAKDASRPFIVHAEETTIQAAGAAFSVGHAGPRTLQVLVDDGLVDVARSDLAGAVRLQAGDEAVAPPTGDIVVRRVGEPSVSRALAWRRGMLDFDGVSLAEAARTFGRYSDDLIVIDDPAVARMTVSGRFASTDPRGFAKAVALSMNLRARAAPGEVHLGR